MLIYYLAFNALVIVDVYNTPCCFEWKKLFWVLLHCMLLNLP